MTDLNDQGRIAVARKATREALREYKRCLAEEVVAEVTGLESGDAIYDAAIRSIVEAHRAPGELD